MPIMRKQHWLAKQPNESEIPIDTAQYIGQDIFVLGGRNASNHPVGTAGYLSKKFGLIFNRGRMPLTQPSTISETLLRISFPSRNTSTVEGAPVPGASICYRAVGRRYTELTERV